MEITRTADGFVTRGHANGRLRFLAYRETTPGTALRRRWERVGGVFRSLDAALCALARPNAPRKGDQPTP